MQDDVLTEIRIEIVGRICGTPHRDDSSENIPTFFEWEVFQQGELKYRLRQK